MWFIAGMVAALLLGVTLGFFFGVNAANTTKVVESTATRHIKDYTKALREVQMQMEALPEMVIDALRESQPDLYEKTRGFYDGR